MKKFSYSTLVRIAFWCAVGYTASNVYAGHIGILYGFTQIGDWIGVSMILRVFCGDSVPAAYYAGSSSSPHSPRHSDDDNSSNFDDEGFCSSYNPATGLMMVGGLDIAGNPYGCSSDDHF